jgi:hypothetical protein
MREGSVDSSRSFRQRSGKQKITLIYSPTFIHSMLYSYVWKRCAPSSCACESNPVLALSLSLTVQQMPYSFI